MVQDIWHRDRKRKPTPRQFYLHFVQSLINYNNDPENDPQTLEEAKELYSFEEYMSGGAYDDDVSEWLYQHGRFGEIK